MNDSLPSVGAAIASQTNNGDFLSVLYPILSLLFTIAIVAGFALLLFYVLRKPIKKLVIEIIREAREEIRAEEEGKARKNAHREEPESSSIS